MKESLEKFQNLLRELFQFDMADLDFGLYRLLRLKREEIEFFITEQLRDEIQAAFGSVNEEERDRLRESLKELAEKISDEISDKAIRKDGSPDPQFADINLVKQYEDKRERLLSIETSRSDEEEVYNHLYNFFNRYYEDGDFIPKRRYGARETYAVPYDGSEVFFHWANKDQYYVKTTETLKDYAFTIEGDIAASGKKWRVRFVLAEASVPKDNVKGERRFFFPQLDNVEYDKKTLTLRIFFEYRPPTEQEIIAYRKTDSGKYPDQDTIFSESIDRILKGVKEDSLRAALSEDQRTENDIADGKDPMPLLLKRLRHFCRKSTSDYFIHKNLRQFLSEELEFYIKDQILHIADLEGDFEKRKSQIKVFRKIGEDIIEFLSQIENAQKILWEKKKFITGTKYLITVGNIDDGFYPEIAACEAQWKEWKELFHINEEKKDLFTSGKSTQEKRVIFLKSHPTLVLDTRHFDPDFVRRLLQSYDNIDEITDGLLIHNENYQALNILKEIFYHSIDCIYIDPPYNTGATEIIYKNGYRDSSWVTLMEARLLLGKLLLNPQGIQCTTIDDMEFHRLRYLLISIFGEENIAGIVIIKNNPSGRSTVKGLSISHEYAILSFASSYSTLGMLPRTKEQSEQYKEEDEIGKFQWRSFLRSGGINDFKKARPKLHYPLIIQGKKIRLPTMDWNENKKEWRILERISSREKIIFPTFNDIEYTWRLGVDSLKDRMKDLRLRSLKGGRQIIEIKFRIDEEGILPKTTWDDKYVNATAYGTSFLRHIMGSPQTFSFPKSIYAVKRCIQICSDKKHSIILDYFAGSGTTGHAVIILNREDGGRRKFILVEMGEYFDTVLAPRIARVIFSPEWREGKPKRMATAEEAERSPRIVKILRLESYEDALHNVASATTQGRVAAREQAVKKTVDTITYPLKYLVSLSLEESDTMLNVEKLAHPFDYTIEILTDEGTREKPVDLVETFNYLYGLYVKRLETWTNEKDTIKVSGKRKKQARSYRIVKATDREQKRHILVAWRDMADFDPELERAFLEAKVNDLQDAGEVYDEMLINGDSATPGWQSLDPLFKRMMWIREEV